MPLPRKQSHLCDNIKEGWEERQDNVTGKVSGYSFEWVFKAPGKEQKAKKALNEGSRLDVVTWEKK